MRSLSVLVGAVVANTLLGLTLREGMAIGVAYGIWGAVGVALTAVLGADDFGETFGSTSAGASALTPSLISAKRLRAVPNTFLSVTT